MYIKINKDKRHYGMLSIVALISVFLMLYIFAYQIVCALMAISEPISNLMK